MATTEVQPQQDTGEATNPVDTLVQHFRDNSTVKSNGIREVNRAGFSAGMLALGVSDVEIKRVQSAMDHATTAAAMLAADDLEGKIGEAGADNLSNDEYRRGLSAMVRLPTPGGKTEVEVKAERVSPVPFRGDADGSGERQTVTKHGVVRVSVNGTGRIAKDLPASLETRMKAALGI